MIVGQFVVEPADQIDHLLWERVGGVKRNRIDRLGGEHIPAGRTTDAEVDAAGKQCFVHAEDFCDLGRTVIGQQHAAGADADA